MWQYFLYVSLSFIITCFLYWKGRFNDVRSFENAILTVVGVILPWVDVVQTIPAIKYGFEGNPLINLIPPEYQLLVLVISHIGYSVFPLALGWIGKSQEKVLARFLLMNWVILLVLLIVINTIFMKIYGLL